jgi:hypothetical protein
MPVVQVPKEFFKNERKQIYANWPMAFWRELVQNAVDAGSRTITIELEQMDGYVTVRFCDDGPGMTRETLEDVYFRLGETTKSGPTNVTRLGGFGRARILTCFSMMRYVIRTQRYLVTGDGANYSIKETDEVRGCHLSIDVDDGTLRDLLGALRVFLRQSQLGCKVIVNGVVWSEWALRGQLVRKLDLDGIEFASVYVLPTGMAKHVIFRSRGVQTFYQLSHVTTQVMIEIEPSMLRDVLTGNRDGLLHGYRAVVDAFIEGMTLNSSALRRNSIRTEPVLVGEQTITSIPNVPPMDFDVDKLVYIFDESDEDSDVAKAAKRFYPERWSIANRKAMITWTVACQTAVTALLRVSGLDKLEWSVGWYFGDASLRAITRRKGALNIFCVNPLNRNADSWIDPDDSDDQLRMLAMAKHEVTHGRYLSHDENFANLLTEIDCILSQDVFHDLLNEKFSTAVKKSKKSFSLRHRQVLQIFEENHPSPLTKEQVIIIWDKRHQYKGDQHPVHPRLSELAAETDNQFGLQILEKVGTVRSSANETVGQYGFTGQGLERWMRAKEMLPDLSAAEALRFERICQEARPLLKDPMRMVFEGIFRAGATGTTLSKLMKSDWVVSIDPDVDPRAYRHATDHLERQNLIQSIDPDARTKTFVATAHIENGG